MNIPIDCVRIIFEYLNDIEVNMHFRIFKKLDKKKNDQKFKYLLWTRIERRDNLYRYILPNLNVLGQRLVDNVDDDSIELDIEINEDKVIYRGGIYRLKLKQNKTIKEHLNWYHVGLLDEYYWDDNLLDYSR
jgi:hypothetical protein